MSSSDMPRPSSGAPPAFPSESFKQPVKPTRTNRMCVASLILGIGWLPIGVMLSSAPITKTTEPKFLFALPVLLTFGLGAIGLVRCKQDPTQRGSWMAVVGIIAVPVSGVAVVILSLRAMGF